MQLLSQLPQSFHRFRGRKGHLPWVKEHAKHSPVKPSQFFYGHPVVIWCCLSRCIILPGVFQKLLNAYLPCACVNLTGLQPAVEL